MPYGTTIFFDEGPGYIYLKTLGSGISGNAVLVRNIKDLKLYVRKEAMQPQANSNNYMEKLDYSRAPQARITDVVAPLGCVVYKHEYGNLFYEVTYWPYYPCGTLANAIDRSKSLRIYFPEIWLAKWLRDMLDVILDIHQVGTVHTDAHLNNWFLKYSGNEPIPRVGLGDWGLAESRNKVQLITFDRFRWADFEMVCGIFGGLIRNQPLSENMSKLYYRLHDAIIKYRTPWDIEVLAAEIRRIRDHADFLRNTLPRASREQEKLVRESRTPPKWRPISTDEFELANEFKGLKHCRWCFIDDRARELSFFGENGLKKIGVNGPYRREYEGGFTACLPAPGRYHIVED